MDLTTLRLEVRERLGELEEDFFTDEEVDRAINEAIRRFCAEEKWPFLMTQFSSALTADDAELTLPDNISLTRIFNIAINGDTLARGQKLFRVSAEEGFNLAFEHENATGCPRWYYIVRSNLPDDEAPPVYYTAVVIPTPDADYDVSGLYMAVPVELTAPSEEPMIPEEYQEAIPAWATGKLFLKEFSISQKASEQFSLYGKVLAQAKKDLQSFDQDEVVAWGRQEPLGRRYIGQRPGLGMRLPPTLGG